MTTNVAASVRQRLLNRSRKTGERFQNLLIRYGIERLLYRMAESPRSDTLVLKGANLFYAWTGELHRPTRDLEMLRYGSAEPPAIVELITDIVTLDVVDDGVTFDSNSIDAAFIREADLYGGIRVKLLARLGSAEIPIQLDIGIGDAVIPEPQFVEFPSLLDMPRPRIRAYSFETAIAEKCEAMVKLGIANSRMKDFYDVYILARDFEFDAELLRDAIASTFERRATELPSEVPTAWTKVFAEDEMKVTQWNAFLRKSRLDAPSLPQVIGDIRAFLDPIRRAIRGEGSIGVRWSNGVWDANR